MDKEILTSSEAALLLDVAPEIVIELLKTSEIAGRKIGGEWRTTKRALLNFIDGMNENAACCGPGMCCPPPATTPRS